MRLKCSNLKAHLVSLHVVDDPYCICNSGVEDNYHYFCECPLYFVQRQELIRSLNDFCMFNLDIVLY